MNGWLCKWVDGPMDGRRERLLNGYAFNWMDAQMNGQMDEWMNAGLMDS